MCVPFRGALYWGPLGSVARETPAASPLAKLENKRPRPDRPVCPLHDDVWRYAVSLPSLSFSCLPRPSPACRLAHDPDPGSGASPVGTVRYIFAPSVCCLASGQQTVVLLPALFCLFFWMQPFWLCLSPWTPPYFSLLTSLCPTVLNVGPVYNCVKTKALDRAQWSWLWGAVWKHFRLFFARGDQVFGEVM